MFIFLIPVTVPYISVNICWSLSKLITKNRNHYFVWKDKTSGVWSICFSSCWWLNEQWLFIKHLPCVIEGERNPDGSAKHFTVSRLSELNWLPSIWQQLLVNLEVNHDVLVYLSFSLLNRFTRMACWCLKWS